MTDDLRWKRYAEKKRFERAIAPEVRAERERKDICRKHVGSLMTRRWV